MTKKNGTRMKYDIADQKTDFYSNPSTRDGMILKSCKG